MAAHLQRLLTKKLDVAFNDAMQKMITTDEMKAALFAIQSNNAHGSNGFFGFRWEERIAEGDLS